MKSSQQITCPKCSHEFSVEEVISKQMEKELKEKVSAEITKMQDKMTQREEILNQEKLAFEEKKKRENEIFAEKLDQEKSKLRLQLEQEVAKKSEEKLKFFEEKSQKQEDELSKLRKTEVQLMELESSIKQERANREIEVQKEILEARQAIEENIRIQENEKHNLRIREYEKKMNDMNKQLEEAQRKAQQGSMQLQGEVLELALEEMLGKAFPFDEISEVPKGVKGADVIQKVRNQLQEVCGIIIYESKRTKSFNAEWIDKLKIDQRATGADIAVIVTETMPREMEGFGQVKGVWVCTFEEIKNLCFVLREMLLRLQSAKESQTNKGDKMELLYDYLTGHEFKSHVTAIVDGFVGMKNDLDREKRSMASIWKRREKQIERITESTIHMYGSIKGIAGNALPSIAQLELPDPENELE